MRLKDAVQKILAPQLGEIGFVLAYSDTRYYSFWNDFSQLDISITVPPRCPSEFLGEYLTNYTRKKEGDPEVKRNAFVVFDYSAKLPEGRYVGLSPYMFEPSMGVKGGFVYCNAKELESKMLQIVDETRAVVIPYMEKISKRYVLPDLSDELTEMLASQSTALSQRAIERFGLPEDRTIGYKMLERVLLEARGDNEEDWKNNFYQNIEDIVGSAAYLSECISEYAVSTKWCWDVTPAIQTSDGIHESTRKLRFSAKYGKGRGEIFDLMQIICDLWNFSPYVKYRHIESIIDEIK